MNGVYRLPRDITVAGAYFFGSGNYFQSLTGLNPFGSNAGQRLRLDGSVISVRDLKGQVLSKLDVRVSKEVRLAGSVRVAGTAEMFNVLNHANYGGYNVVEGLSNYRQPTRHLGTMYMPRSAQLGVRLSF
jgi:hypothetical protein